MKVLPDGLRLFRVETGGATYWILGDYGLPAEMQAAIEQVEGVTFDGEDWGPLEPGDIREVHRKEARGVVCRCEDEPDLDMWTAAAELAVRGPDRVVACSEWP